MLIASGNAYSYTEFKPQFEIGDSVNFTSRGEKYLGYIDSISQDRYTEEIIYIIKSSSFFFKRREEEIKPVKYKLG